MGEWKKRGVENLTNDIPTKKGFWSPPRTVRFPPPLRWQCSVFPVQKSTTGQTRSSLKGGIQKFSGERVLWYVFLPPIRFAPHHITPQLNPPPRIRVKQAQCGKLAFLQQNGAFLGQTNAILGRFAPRFQSKSLVQFCANNGLLARLVL